MVRNVSFEAGDDMVRDLDHIVADRDDLNSRSDAIREAIVEYINSHD